MLRELSEDKSYPINDETEAIMKNSTTNNDGETTEDKKTANSFFTRSTLSDAHVKPSLSTYESDDITPFYILGYN